MWAQRAELTGTPFPPATAPGHDLSGLVIDLDASIVVCAESAAWSAAFIKHADKLIELLATTAQDEARAA